MPKSFLYFISSGRVFRCDLLVPADHCSYFGNHLGSSSTERIRGNSSVRFISFSVSCAFAHLDFTWCLV